MLDVTKKIELILKRSGLSQEKLAREIGVSFPALNAWLHGRAIPRATNLAKIEELYLEYTGQKIVSVESLEKQKRELEDLRKKNRGILKTIISRPDLYKEFLLSLTYNSNKIEGSTLSEQETSAILFDKAVLPNKSQVEQLEVHNHEAALLYLFNTLSQGLPISEKLLLAIHGKLMNAIMPDAGLYRRHGVRITGANVPTANYLRVPELIKKLFANYNPKPKDPVAQASSWHAKFEQIHPFSDGNGRVGRLILTGMLLASDYPPALIKQEDRPFYYAYLSRAQTKDDYSALTEFVGKAVLASYKLLDEK